MWKLFCRKSEKNVFRKVPILACFLVNNFMRKTDVALIFTIVIRWGCDFTRSTTMWVKAGKPRNKENKLFNDKKETSLGVQSKCIIFRNVQRKITH